LVGLKSLHWACHCGTDGNWASRIVCRCGKNAPQRIVQAAHRAATAAKGEPKEQQQQPRGKWAKGPPLRKGGGQGEEVAALKVELERLRGMVHEQEQSAEKDEMGVDEGPSHEVDLQKVQAAYAAVVSAFGVESPQATELGREVSRIQEAKRQSKHVSVQIRAAERRVAQRKKGVESARLATEVAAEAVQQAQKTLVEVQAKVAASEEQLQEAKNDLQELCQKSVQSAPTVRDYGDVGILGRFDANFLAAEASPEELEALKRAEAIVTKLRTQLADTQVVQNVAIDADVGELERQASAAKLYAEETEERYQVIKRGKGKPPGSSRVEPYVR
jgi:hypothetical protein